MPRARANCGRPSESHLTCAPLNNGNENIGKRSRDQGPRARGASIRADTKSVGRDDGRHGPNRPELADYLSDPPTLRGAATRAAGDHSAAEGNPHPTRRRPVVSGEESPVERSTAARDSSRGPRGGRAGGSRILRRGVVRVDSPPRARTGGPATSVRARIISALHLVKPRRVTQRVWHHGSPTRGLLDCLLIAKGDGRYHERGGPNTWYSSSTERGAWAEFLRHHESPDVSPFEVRRRVGRATVSALAILDLTVPDTRRAIGITEDDLRSDDLTRCQELANAARAAGFEGILAPSAALAGAQTLAVFVNFLGKVREEHSRVRRPPVRMRDLLRHVRLPNAADERLKRLFRRLAGRS